MLESFIPKISFFQNCPFFSALVEFFEPSEARKAFKRLAYSKFKTAPLYLEWAPDDGLSEAPLRTNENKKEDNASKKNQNSKTETLKNNKEAEPVLENNENREKSDDEEEDDEPEPNTILFVKNLNFNTTEEDLRKV